VLWNDTIGLSPMTHALPDGLTLVPVADLPSSRLVVAWPAGSVNPLVRSFIRQSRDSGISGSCYGLYVRAARQQCTCLALQKRCAGIQYTGRRPE
jgi:hypothetical protein